MTAQIIMVLLHGSLRTWGEFLRRASALAKRRRMRGYDADKLSAACNSPALVDQGLPGGVANTAANRNQIQWAGSVVLDTAGPTYSCGFDEGIWKSRKGGINTKYLRQKTK
ncbi:hypothetical protein I5Q83_04905 [Enterocloster clostridioformis]|nr:hypothetical protein I5Q83_04905 [Enterocloster clostridioformis]